MLRSLCSWAILALACLPARAAEPEAVSFPGRDGGAIQARLYRPGGVGPHPAVVALHGCGGLYDRRGAVGRRHADWGQRLSAAGLLVLLPDSLGSRGLGPQCRNASRDIRPGRGRADDAEAALAYLAARGDVKPGAINLLGWSNGGSTVLHAVGRRTPEGADYARAVAFYPGCRPVAERGGWRPRMPLLVLMGEADDWTPAEPCKTLVASARAAGAQVSLTLYPGAHHGFDAPDEPVRARRGLAYTADGSGTAHSGTDPAARADALARVPAFLAR